MTRSTLLAAAAVAALSTAGVTATPASAAISTLGGCYDAVITWCNSAHPNHASECASGGMDECDEEFGNAPAGTTFDRLVVPSGAEGFKFRLLRARIVVPVQEGGSDGDAARGTAGR